MPKKTKTIDVPKNSKRTTSKNLPVKGHERVVMRWLAPEYLRHEKSLRWYIGASIALVLFLLWAFISNNLTMAAALIVFAAVYYYIHTYHPPKNIEITISEMGIQIGDQFYSYSHIQAFWIIYEHGLKTLNFRVTGHWFADVIVQLDSEDPVAVRHYLVTQIPEWEGRQERLGDMILRFLKF